MKHRDGYFVAKQGQGSFSTAILGELGFIEWAITPLYIGLSVPF
jgi:hypothetical protein